MTKQLTEEQEKFCQAIVDGMNGMEAYLHAGYKTTAKGAGVSASRMLTRPHIMARIDALRARKLVVERRVTDKVVAKLALTKERVLREYEKVAFSNPSQVMEWGGENVQSEGDEGGKYVNYVRLKPSHELDDMTLGAIAEVSQTSGGLKVKMHDKMAALLFLAKELGMGVEKVHVTGAIDVNPHDEAQRIQLARWLAWIAATRGKQLELTANKDEAQLIAAE